MGCIENASSAENASTIKDLTVKNKMSLWCNEKEKFFKFFSSDA